MSLPTDAKARKNTPMARGLLDYFPDALAEVARLSHAGNDQHNPGKPLHWDRSKSGDHADCILRHLVDRGTLDTDGMRHSAKVAWRALAQLQLELEDAMGEPVVELCKIPAGSYVKWNYEKGCAEVHTLSVNYTELDIQLGDDEGVEAESYDSSLAKTAQPGNSELYIGLNGWIHAYQDYEDSRS